MSNLVIVALPEEDDYINKISSEKVPHMTLLFLGEDASKVKNISKILDFTKHAAEQTLTRFDMQADRRGTIGQDEADVLFFKKSKWSGFEAINSFRSNLLQETNIRTAYDSAVQHDEWLPHLTLGYPATPAKPDERDYPKIYSVCFDRIAVWFADYDGIEFPLKEYEWDEVMAMGNDATENVLVHYGKKGMRWGHHVTRSTSEFHRKNPTSESRTKEIHRARASVRRKKKAFEGATDAKKREQLRKIYLRSPDRVTAQRLTRGEKATFSVLAVASSPIGLPLFGVGIAGGTVARVAIRRHTEKKQARKGYT